jgi:hypothetical protein
VCLKNKSQAIESKELLVKFSKKLSHVEEENYEIAKIFGRFGHIFYFLLFKSSYLAKRF